MFLEARSSAVLNWINDQEEHVSVSINFRRVTGADNNSDRQVGSQIVVALLQN